MAALVRHGQIFVFSSGQKLAVYDRREKKLELLDTVHVQPEHDIPMEEPKGCSPTEGTHAIQAMSFSSSGEWFVTCNDKKELTLWRTNHGKKWDKISTRIMQRRANQVTFTHSNDAILVGDKAGDVYSFRVEKPTDGGVLLMGHLSMLLDIAITPQDKFIITCDRDEKIRVSRHPNAYNIHTYCLGHTEFVSQVLVLGESNLLVSGSGDSTLRLWDYEQGKQLAMTDCLTILVPGSDENTEDQSTNNIAIHRCRYYKETRILAVCFSGIKKGLKEILIYKISAENNRQDFVHEQTISLSESPWDLQFDADGNLWVLQEKEDEAVAIFMSDSSGQYSKISEESELGECTKILNNHWDFFKASLGAENIYTILYKQRVDNMPDYFTRKERKLKKQKLPQPEALEPAAKVAKHS